MMYSNLSRCLRAALVFSGLTGIAVACSSSDEARRASSLAGGCIINSDCQKDLICAFERCHAACIEDRDCKPDPLRCVKSEETDIFVCQLEDETHCKTEKDCPGDQVCGVDQECRDACEEHDDCIGDQICAASNECASTVEAKDTVDPEGNIIPEPDPVSGGSGGTGNTAGTSGTGATGATSSEGGAGTGSGGVPAQPTAGDAAGGAVVTGEAGTSTVAGGPNLPTVEYEETDDGVETVDNDDYDHAVAITKTARFFLDHEADDSDWFSYLTPDDGRGHILTLVLDQDAPVTTVVSLRLDEADMYIESDFILAKGETRSVYVTVAPNTTALFGFSGWSTGSSGFVNLTLTDEPEQDEHEPNNTPEEAKRIELGETVTGILLNPKQSPTVDLAQDWFEIELAQGTATFAFTTLPGEGRASVLYRPPGNTASILLWSPSTGTPESRNVTVSAATAGLYRFNVKIYSENAVPPSAVTLRPRFYDEPYSFTITQ